MTSALDGSTSALAALSPDNILLVRPSATSGTYWLDPGGLGTYKKQYFCLMNPSGSGSGGWTLMMYILRQPGGFTLDNTAAVGTVPHLNPYIVGASQAKEDNAVIALLQPLRNGRYAWLMDNFQWAANRAQPPGYPTTTSWPAAGSVLASVDNSGVVVTSPSYVRGAFSLLSTVPLRGAGTKMTGSTCSNFAIFADPTGNAFNIAAVTNTPGQHGYDSTTRIYDMTIGAGTSTVTATQAYASTCNDGLTGPYTFLTTYNCYHSVTMLYVR